MSTAKGAMTHIRGRSTLSSGNSAITARSPICRPPAHATDASARLREFSKCVVHVVKLEK